MAVFENDRTTLSGAVPSQAAADRLVAFAVGYGLTPAPVVNNLTIDSDAPATGGIRVVEFNSVHFLNDTEIISPDHATQLDRIVGVMNASPDLTLHVVGNTDQVGEETRNFVISQRRADAVVAYLVDRGIDRSRLTTEPGGESNPLSALTTDEANALNRRTDFVFYGLLDT